MDLDGDGVVLVNEDGPVEVDGRDPVVFEKEEVPDGAEGLVEPEPEPPFEIVFDEVEPEPLLEVVFGVEEPPVFLAVALDATVRVGMPSDILLHPTKASDATLSAVGRLSGERYLHPANARAPMLESFPSR